MAKKHEVKKEKGEEVLVFPDTSAFVTSDYAENKTKLPLLSLDLGREDLNAVVAKINDIIRSL